MEQLRLYNVAPRIPKPLKFLEELSYNMWWAWHPLAIELFERISPTLWREVYGNCRVFLNRVPQERLEELVKDKLFVQQMKLVEDEFRREVKGDLNDFSKRKVAYFSLEFGIHESIRLYSGGLGILAGDHLKAASDMELPIVGVGLLYRQGYFRQYIDRNGWQTERYPENLIHNMPLVRAIGKDGHPLTISIPLVNRELKAAVWILHVGNVPLVLLDTEISENPPDFREITWQLYGGDKNRRIQQEILLGVGGFRALVALGCEPACCHMNEGHAAFLSIARIEYLVNQYKYDPNTAMEVVWRSNVFTTHTPVPAGNEVFDVELAKQYLAPFCADAKLDLNRVINWGVPIAERNISKEMSMTILGLRMAIFSNGVSRLHGEVAREMWKHLWPGRAVDEIPIDHITNGVHVPTWLSNCMAMLFNRYLSPDWQNNPAFEELVEDVERIPDEELWTAHESERHALVREVRRRLKVSLDYYNSHNGNSSFADRQMLDPNILTIGFARRFATYKRGNLLLRNPDRLLAILRNTSRPVQFIFAGKAHPADDGGKRIIQQLIQFGRDNNVADRFLVLENYNMGLARELVHGVDVWLNNPRRPQEASGTSGMKAAINGVPNCSILDGWWDEAWTPEVGWAIPSNENYDNPEDQDNCESQALFDLLENEIIPCFYERLGSGYPRRWVKLMKGSIAMSLSRFSSRRMVGEYDCKFYQPSVANYDELMLNDAAKAKALVDNKNRLVANFDKLWIAQPELDRDLSDLHVGDSFEVRTRVFLNELKPEDVDVEVYYGHVDAHNDITNSFAAAMTLDKDLGNGNYEYRCTITCLDVGSFGLTARITPVGDDWVHSVPGFACWPK